MSNCIGIDISKASLNVHISKSSQDLVLENSLKGFKSLYGKLKNIYKKEIGEIIFIYEPTGSYSEGIRRYCFTQNIKCFIVNPKQFSNYAKALGVEVKNDIEDARVLSSAVALAKDGQVVPQYDEDVELIKELMGYYKFIVKQMGQQKNHLEALSAKEGSSFAIKSLKQSIQESKEKAKNIIDKIQEIINANPKYKNDYDNIISMTGIGQISAIALLHLFMKYPEANQREITSLAGLNPVYRQSGTSIQSKSSISKSGSQLYRGILFMGVFSAVRFDDNFKAFYDRLIANGKQTTQAQIAVMRKMIITAHSLYKNNRKYNVNFAKDGGNSNE